jgi:hypothetical protein
LLLYGGVIDVVWQITTARQLLCEAICWPQTVQCLASMLQRIQPGLWFWQMSKIGQAAACVEEAARPRQLA